MISVKMHEYLLKRTVHQRKFERLDKTISSLLQGKPESNRIIENRLNELSACWQSLQEAHDLYIISCFTDTEEIEQEDEVLETLSSRFYATELNCENYLSQRIEERKPNTAPENVIKLERFKFPIFDGDIRKYAKFRYEFNKFVKPMCSTNQLTFILKGYLCDSVKKDVENFDNDINRMWQRLDSKYGSKQKLIDSIISDFKQLPESNDSPAMLLKTIDVIEAAHNELECIDATEELNNSTILSMIEQRMTTKMHEEWVQIAIETAPSQRFNKLMPFLDNWKNRIEYGTSKLRLAPENVDSFERKCLIHQNCKHPIWRCRTFQALTIPERLEIVRKSQACILCLDIGHVATNCTKVKQCSHNGCTGKHNLLLHDEAR